MKITILGSGTSHGVPMIACDCEVCHSDDPRDKRTRCSVAIQCNGETFIIDTTPELRLQVTTHGINRLDAVFITHTHADHIHGLDDLRAFNMKQKAPIPIYGNARSINDIRERFSYVFASEAVGGGLPMLDLRAVDGPFIALDRTVIPVPILHGSLPVNGYRLGSFAYLTDCSSIPESSFALLQDLDVLVIDALRHRPHPTHFTIPQALEIVERLQPRQTYLTHLTHDVKHVRESEGLPDGVALAYDGLSFEVPNPYVESHGDENENVPDRVRDAK